jgi:hypothetical protein
VTGRWRVGGHWAGGMRLMTPQGSKPVEFGDWVVRGVVGEWYPVQNRVWVRRYREAGDSDMPTRDQLDDD